MQDIEKQYVIDALAEDSWRMFRILGEFAQGFEELAGVNKAVTIFGSARVTEDSPVYASARNLAKELAEAGYAVLTGGGPGVMEAANRGALDGGGQSFGLNIDLPHEQAPNLYVTPELCFNFHYFAVRKMHFIMRAKAVAVFPGGFGTMDEFFETLTLIQTGRMERVPIILFGEEFWRRAIDLDYLAEQGTISPGDQDIIDFVDSADEAWEIIKKFYKL